jgi:hypothetical protein
MTTIKKVALVAAVILCVLIPAGAISAGAATVTSEAAYKAATDNDPHLPLTAGQEKMRARKIQAVLSSVSGTTSTSVKTGTASNAASVVATATTDAPSSASLTKDQSPQKEHNWCGPATVNEALGQLGKWITQETLAIHLATNSSGTAWSMSPSAEWPKLKERTGFPVPDVMNHHQAKNYYVPERVPVVPGDTDVNNYKALLTYDVGTLAAPVIGNAFTTRYSEFWLVGHPRDIPIYHWFDIYGYRVSGGTTYTRYEDSVYNAPSVSWHDMVTQPYSDLPSHQIVHIVGDRGYVW